MEDQISRLAEQLRERINSRGLPVEAAQQSLRDDMTSWGAPAEALEALDSAAQRIRDQQTKIEWITAGESIKTKRDPWYAGPDSRSINWNAYQTRLIAKGWEDTVDDIDRTSTQVVALLNNPGESKFAARGLVLGYVQSGKTANMTGVIAKAADAGYQLVIILTGMIEKLRQQTQARIESDLTTLPGTSEWVHWTSGEEDFGQKTYPGFNFNPSHRNLMVIKKQTNVLQRITQKLENTPEIGRNLPVLVIDDECDQASVNAPGKTDEWKAINRLIRQMMNQFPRHTYVGYTATPFANVLIDPNYDPSRPPDLYPRDFIYSLPAPKGYFGAELLFGRDLLDAEVELRDDEELEIIQTIPEEEIPHLKPSADDPDFIVTEALDRAINYFLIATAIRDSRGQRDGHSTMLIHTSHLKDDHRLVCIEVRRVVKAKLQQLELRNASFMSDLEQIFDEEAAKVPPSLFGNAEHRFVDIVDGIEATARCTRVVIENSESDDRLDYDGADSGEGRRYICIGGNVISRGLTLEGLVSTFFMRTSRQYDTLMQMGRWFGYRPGYADLPRVWMTVEMQENFRALATVEADLREMIGVYEQEDHGITPMDVPVRIRQVPGLAVTARNKMHAARQVRVSFGGAHRQTTHFSHKNLKILKSNWSAADKLLAAAHSTVGMGTAPDGRGLLAKSVPRSMIEQFLHDYTIHPTHAEMYDQGFQRNHLLEYISKRKEFDPEELSFWNVGVIVAKGDQTASLCGQKIAPINRSRLEPPLRDGDADIKALMSRSDIIFDLVDHSAGNLSWEKLKELRENELGPNSPLLLLYPIDKNSVPKRDHGPRRPLDAVHDVMGFGIVFPRTGAATAYVEVDITPSATDEEYEAQLSSDVS